jgi:hypothetical protein
MLTGKHVLILMVICAFLTGCVTTTGADPAALKADKYKQILDPMLGIATKADIMSRYGEPLRKERVGDNELWYYKKTFDAYKTGYSEPADSRASRPGVSKDSWEIFDELKFEFDKNSILSKWEVNVQR